MVQFLSIKFFSSISSIFVGFFKSSRFFVSLCTISGDGIWVWSSVPRLLSYVTSLDNVKLIVDIS